MSVSVKLHVALPGLTREQATDELTSFVDKASETSRSQLQNLIEELKALQPDAEPAAETESKIKLLKEKLEAAARAQRPA